MQRRARCEGMLVASCSKHSPAANCQAQQVLVPTSQGGREGATHSKQHVSGGGLQEQAPEMAVGHQQRASHLLFTKSG